MKTYLVCYGTPSPRAVVIGQSIVEPVIGQPITLDGARMVLYWDAACGGLYGLAANGPKGSTRITAPVPRWAVTVAEWAEMSDDVAAKVAAWSIA